MPMLHSMLLQAWWCWRTLVPVHPCCCDTQLPGRVSPLQRCCSPKGGPCIRGGCTALLPLAECCIVCSPSQHTPSPPAPVAPPLFSWLTTGMPRAYNITDRFHPEEDGAEPRVAQTVLQQHVEFFDYVSAPPRPCTRLLEARPCATSLNCNPPGCAAASVHHAKTQSIRQVDLSQHGCPVEQQPETMHERCNLYCTSLRPAPIQLMMCFYWNSCRTRTASSTRGTPPAASVRSATTRC